MSREIQVLCLALVVTPAAARAQRVHEIRLERVADGTTYRFRPAEVRVSPGDAVEFAVVSGGPYVIEFEAADLRPGDRAALNAAIPEPSGDLRSPVLRAPGSRLRIVIPPLSSGTYRFRALTHVAYRMAGRLVVR